MNFTSEKKRLQDGKDLNTLAASAMENSLKTNKKKNTDNESDSENRVEKFNFKNLDIGADYK